MGTAAAMLAEARRSLGVTGRPNYITRDYSRRHGSGFLTAPWCDMSITYWARQSGTTAAVLPGGDRAYTVWHAQDFQKAGRWHTGTIANVNRARPGDIVFFDWGASDRIGAIDHVGVIEKPLGGGRVQTIEGNTDNACLRRVRSAGVIAGFGRPAYGSDNEEDDVSAEEVWSYPIDTGPGRKTDKWKAGTVLGHLEIEQDKTNALLAQLTTQVAALAQQSGADVDEAAIVQGVLAGLSPEAVGAAVVAAFPPDMARRVVDEMSTRLES